MFREEFNPKNADQINVMNIRRFQDLDEMKLRMELRISNDKHNVETEMKSKFKRQI